MIDIVNDVADKIVSWIALCDRNFIGKVQWREIDDVPREMVRVYLEARWDDLSLRSENRHKTAIMFYTSLDETNKTDLNAWIMHNY